MSFAMQEALVVDSISGPLSKREKDVIKDRYTRFNEELERIQTMQQDFAIPNKVAFVTIYFNNFFWVGRLR